MMMIVSERFLIFATQSLRLRTYRKAFRFFCNGESGQFSLWCKNE